MSNQSLAKVGCKLCDFGGKKIIALFRNRALRTIYRGGKCFGVIDHIFWSDERLSDLSNSDTPDLVLAQLFCEPTIGPPE
jgi:hypothetical protein